MGVGHVTLGPGRGQSDVETVTLRDGQIEWELLSPNLCLSEERARKMGSRTSPFSRAPR